MPVGRFTLSPLSLTYKYGRHFDCQGAKNVGSWFEPDQTRTSYTSLAVTNLLNEQVNDKIKLA